MEFWDREVEKNRIKKQLNKDGKTCFIVIYGRRRLGKSTLIRQVLSKDDIYFEADRSEQSQQRHLLCQTFSQAISGIDQIPFTDYDAILNYTNRVCKKGVTICIDEFPYLVEKCPELPSILQKHIDSGLNFNLIICGSSQRMMQKMVLQYSEPLYGRADDIINLKPIKIEWLKEALNLSASQTIEEYSVWGGVPRYWKLRKNYPSLRSAIMELMLQPESMLLEEPLRLFFDDTENTTQLSTILSIVGSGANRLSEIAGRLEKPATALSAPLNRLISMGYLRREVAWGDDNSHSKSKKTYYRINDPFLDFYYHFLVAYRSAINIGKGDYVMEKIDRNFSEYVSFHWEDICRQFISGNNIFGQRWEMAQRWWGNVPNYDRDENKSKYRPIEIDVIAMSEDGKHILIGECKWTNKENATRVLEELKRKTSTLPIAEGKERVYVLFLKEDATYKKGINVITPNDLL